MPPGHLNLPFCLYLSYTVSFDLLSDASEVLPARQPCLFKSHAGDTYLSDTVGIVPLSGVGESLPARQTHLFHPAAGETYLSRLRVFTSCWMSARASRPHNVTFSVFTCPTQRVLISRRTPARCSRPDNLTFSSPSLDETYPSVVLS